MKKNLGFILAAVLAFGLAGCTAAQNSSSTAQSAQETASAASGAQVIRVGASPAPHAEILEQAADLLAEKGYQLEIVEFDDYVMPNTALAEGSLEANYFQHQPYLTNFNAEQGTDLVSAGAIHYEPLGVIHRLGKCAGRRENRHSCRRNERRTCTAAFAGSGCADFEG